MKAMSNENLILTRILKMLLILQWFYCIVVISMSFVVAHVLL